MIQPLRYFGPGDCLEVDYTSVLINYMVRNDLQYGQDVRWSDLVTRSEFEGEITQLSSLSSLLHSLLLGTTPRYLQRLYDKAVSAAKRKYGLTKEEVTSVILLAWVEDRKWRKKKNRELIERDEKILEFYQFLQKK